MGHSTRSSILIILFHKEKHTETLIDVSKEVGPEVNMEKTEYMLPSCKQNAGQNHDMKVANRSYKSVAQFKYL
jgi:hypothetical protein